MTNEREWSERLADRRGKRVIFLSHCLLNENTRYPGGACRPGCVEEVVQSCLDRGLGIVQMPCPEEQAWGGVLKRKLLRFFDSEGTAIFRFRRAILPLLVWQTRRAYRRIARQVADQIEDYCSSGFTVAGIVGVNGSPSCGVLRTLDVKRAVESVGRLTPFARVADINAIVQGCVIDGRGIFIELLQDELNRRHLEVPFQAHDLVAELRGAQPLPFERGRRSMSRVFQVAGSALIALALAGSASAQTSGNEWAHGTTLNLFVGAGVDASETNPVGGGSVGWELWPNLAIEGSGYWFHRDSGDDAFAAALKAQVGLMAGRSAVPFLEAGVGLYRTPLDAGMSTDPSLLFGGGVNVYLTRQIVLRPAVEILVVRRASQTDVVPVAAISLAYHFEDHPITPAQARR